MNNENKVLVGKRLDNPENYWQMPEGGVDNNEDFFHAAILKGLYFCSYQLKWLLKSSTFVQFLNFL